MYSRCFVFLLLWILSGTTAQIYEEAGQSVTLPCDYNFSGARYTIDWHRGAERLLNFFSEDSNPTIDSADFTGRLSLQDGKSLVISTLRRTDDGRYYCAVSEIGGNPPGDGSDQNVVVTVSPTITLSPTATAATGSDYTLTCTVDSKPAANVTWTGPNGDLGTGNSVVLRNVQPANDTGTYTCTATNSFSATKSVSRSVVLTVQDMTTAKPTPSRQTESTVGTSNNLASTGLSTGAQAGLGVGIALGCIALAGVLAYFFVVKRKRAGRDKDDGVESGGEDFALQTPPGGHPGAPENLSRPPPNEPEVMYAELDLKNAPAGSRRPYVATPDDEPTEYAQIRPDKPPRSSVPHTLGPDNKTEYASISRTKPGRRY